MSLGLPTSRENDKNQIKLHMQKGLHQALHKWLFHNLKHYYLMRWICRGTSPKQTYLAATLRGKVALFLK